MSQALALLVSSKQVKYAGGVDFDLGLAEKDNKPAVIEAFYPGQMGGVKQTEQINKIA